MFCNNLLGMLGKEWKWYLFPNCINSELDQIFLVTKLMRGCRDDFVVLKVCLNKCQFIIGKPSSKTEFLDFLYNAWTQLPGTFS